MFTRAKTFVSPSMVRNSEKPVRPDFFSFRCCNVQAFKVISCYVYRVMLYFGIISKDQGKEIMRQSTQHVQSFAEINGVSSQ